MSHGHIKDIEFYKKGATYELQIDAEDQDNLVIENVTIIDGPRPEHDLDPTIFEDGLDIDDWQRIKEALKTK